MELEKTVLATAHLRNFKKHASFLIKDGLKIARLAFVDVSAAELMTEDATNEEEWGPTTKTMASISDAAYNTEDYSRIVQVLHGRFSLTGKKYWRQVYKSLTLLEYLLTHGPDRLVMEFRAHKDRIEELTRFVYVDENLVDRGSLVQKKAKQVQKLLTDVQYYKEERRRAQKISKGILGFGNQPMCHRSAPSSPTSEDFRTSPPPKAYQFNDDSKWFVVSDVINHGIKPDFQKCNTYPGTVKRAAEKAPNVGDQGSGLPSESEASSPASQRCTSESIWSAFSSCSGGDSPNTSSGASTDWNPFEDSMASAQSSTSSSSSPIADGWNLPVGTCTSPLRRISEDIIDKSSTASSKRSALPAKLKAEVAVPGSPPPLFKLPPPPSLPAYKCTVPPPPPGGSKVGRQVPQCLKPAQPLQDLIDM